MKLFHLLDFTAEVGLARQFLLLDLNCFLDGSRFLKEPVGLVCHAFEAFSRSCILLGLEMISFLPKLFLRIAEFVHLLRMFSRFYPHF